MIKGLLVVALYVYKHQEFMEVLLPDKIEQPEEQKQEQEESKGKKKKNKKKGNAQPEESKKKDHSVQLLGRYVENISLKIFEDKQE